MNVKTNQNAQGVANNASNLATSVKKLAANLTNVQNNLYENITGVQTSLDSKIETVRATADSAKQIADTSYGNAKYNRELIDSINNKKIPQLATKDDARKDADDAVAKVIANAPESFDTLKEIADWIGSDEKKTADLVTEINKKQDKGDYALKGDSYTKTEADNKLAAKQDKGDYVTTSAFTTQLATKQDSGTYVTSNTAGTTIWLGTQTEYDALTTKDNNTVYIIHS